MRIEDLKVGPLVPEPKSDYQCVLVGDVWHLTQEQAVPPSVLRDGAWTSCAVWAGFKRGYEHRRPNCPVCLEHAMRWETKCAKDSSCE